MGQLWAELWQCGIGPSSAGWPTPEGRRAGPGAQAQVHSTGHRQAALPAGAAGTQPVPRDGLVLAILGELVGAASLSPYMGTAAEAVQGPPGLPRGRAAPGCSGPAGGRPEPRIRLPPPPLPSPFARVKWQELNAHPTEERPKVKGLPPKDAGKIMVSDIS